MSLSVSLRVEKQTERPLNKTNALRRQEWTPFLADFLEGGYSAGAVKDRRQKNPEPSFCIYNFVAAPLRLGNLNSSEAAPPTGEI
jgi:hypothetical protein